MIATTCAVYLKLRPNGASRKTPVPKHCDQHDVVCEKFEEGNRRFRVIEETLITHGKTLTSIQCGIASLDAKMDILSRKT